MGFVNREAEPETAALTQFACKTVLSVLLLDNLVAYIQSQSGSLLITLGHTETLADQFAVLLTDTYTGIRHIDFYASLFLQNRPP